MGSQLARVLVAVLAAAVATVVAAPVSQAAPTVVNGCVAGVPDPGTTVPVQICYTIFRPESASSANRVPVVFHSHGWGGSRATAPEGFADFLGAGFGVLSFDQRGFGESGGVAQLENPDLEGQDVQRLVDVVAGLDWVKTQRPGDPVIGAIGGSYGGGYQFVGAFSELRDRGATRFDALAPEITWHDLGESLAPQGVPRTLWALLLYAAGTPSAANPQAATVGLVEAAATGNWPPNLAAFIAKNGPAWHVSQGRKLNIPVLFGQGETDNLFPLDQGLKNFQRALTPGARARSILVGYNGGHTLPSVLPMGAPDAAAFLAATAEGGLPTDDPCSKKLNDSGFRALSLRFFQEELQGKSTGLGGRGHYHLATLGGRCVTLTDTAATQSVRLGSVVSTVGVGLPLHYPIASGPITIAGTPTLDAKVTSLSLDSRLMLALSVGTSPLDAQIVQNNMLPLREPGIVLGKTRTGVELPSVAVDVPAGKHLYLTVSPLSDMSFGHGSRLPGAMALNDVVVNLPVR
ncbi:X-Pro dipeptidyl-peptidase (S15 family) [Actinokineospora alba]|uniref:X-Pro dipeptidyl-peptidase (S15 family) n=1 Tax=Actinokineospora alba TaxID=504798 RepID=A0A1H0ENH7_9PSEU|nr:alpha/beta fold hydrolase [Actinokineospora alba]TDP69153.1 X-Pro dipeptidyl-peptidase-like protein [Actinokineospora alba]SDI23189.1 X-Pro dipeptidyl-peptidase (S15 family) [Actinokineospora alba]SDN83932.1 X-Pro dipeptidyl-peptidase (S15 family) [Actinokineospora alba]